jgi:hypothetical protein
MHWDGVALPLMVKASRNTTTGTRMIDFSWPPGSATDRFSCRRTSEQLVAVANNELLSL